MKRFLLSTVLLLSIASSASIAQDTLSTNNSRRVKDAWTMEFGVAPNFTLSSFQGTTISVSRYMSDFQKTRISFSTSLNSSSSSTQESNLVADTIINRTNGNIHQGGNVIQVAIQHLVYSTPAERFSLYGAAGPVAGMAWDLSNGETENTQVNWSTFKSTGEIELKQYFVGLLISCGVEWFFSERISLHAEYSIAGRYNWEERTETMRNQLTYTAIPNPSVTGKAYTSSSSSWSLQSQNILLGLSVIL